MSTGRYASGRAIALAVLVLAGWLPVFAQTGGGTAAPPQDTDFKRIAAQLAEQRRSGLEEHEELQERALRYLDEIVLGALNRNGPLDLAALNRRLAWLRSQPDSSGENYEVVKLGDTHTGLTFYALVVNFSLGGPSAVRVYPPSPQGYRLAARIDRFAQKDFFDEYLEVVPIKASDVLFVTVSGRTDELKSGSFTCWRFAENRLSAVWSTDILERSAYEERPDGFHLSYCSQTDESYPRTCRKMTRERYLWDGAAWRRVEQETSDAPKP